MEFWDIYDQFRKKRGYSIRKTNTLKEGDYHLVAHVCLFNSDNQMLIQKRKETQKNWPGKWDISAGGAALAGENSNQAAERELYEELSIKIPLDNKRPIITIHFDQGFDDYFVVDVDNSIISQIVYQEEEIDSIKWASFDEIVDLIDEGQFDILKPFVELVFAMRKKRGNHYN